jgi:hypothetical protein
MLLPLPLLHTCSEKKLRRLEVANESKRLARLPLFRLLSHSEGRWADELARAGVAADGSRAGECTCQCICLLYTSLCCPDLPGLIVTSGDQLLALGAYGGHAEVCVCATFTACCHTETAAAACMCGCWKAAPDEQCHSAPVAAESAAGSYSTITSVALLNLHMLVCVHCVACQQVELQQRLRVTMQAPRSSHTSRAAARSEPGAAAESASARKRPQRAQQPQQSAASSPTAAVQQQHAVHQPHQQQQVVVAMQQQLLASPSGRAAAGVSVRGANASPGVRQPARGVGPARAAVSSKKTTLAQTTRLQQLAARQVRPRSSSSSSRETGRAGALALSAPAGRVEAGARGRRGSGARRALLQQVEVQPAVLQATAMTARQMRLQGVLGRTLVQGLGRVGVRKVQQMVTGTAGRTAGMAAVMLGVSGPSVPRVGAGVSGRSGSAWRHG